MADRIINAIEDEQSNATACRLACISKQRLYVSDPGSKTTRTSSQ
jgi:hypothetical protein